MESKLADSPQNSGNTVPTQPESLPSRESPLCMKSIPQFPEMKSPFRLFVQPVQSAYRPDYSPLRSPEISSPKDWDQIMMKLQQKDRFGPRIWEEKPQTATFHTQLDSERDVRPITTTRLMSSRSHQIFDNLTERNSRTARGFNDSPVAAQASSSNINGILRSVSNQNHRNLEMQYVQVSKVDDKERSRFADSTPTSVQHHQPVVRNNMWFKEPAFLLPQISNQKLAAPRDQSTENIANVIYKPLLLNRGQPEIFSGNLADAVSPHSQREGYPQQYFPGEFNGASTSRPVQQSKPSSLEVPARFAPSFQTTVSFPSPYNVSHPSQAFAGQGATTLRLSRPPAYLSPSEGCGLGRSFGQYTVRRLHITPSFASN